MVNSVITEFLHELGTDEECFVHMLCVSPLVFNAILELIKDHPIFKNNSTSPQTPVDYQLAVTLYRMGRYGNGASDEDIGRIAGCGEGTVRKFVDRCFTGESVRSRKSG